MDLLKMIQSFMEWYTRALAWIACMVYNYPKMWICTYIIKSRIKKEPESVVIDAGKANEIILMAATNPNVCRIELTDRIYVLPKREWIEYIVKNLWVPYKRIKQIVYGKNYDCDNFAVSLLDLVQELGLGLCIGIAHYGFMDNGKYVCHAVDCFIPMELTKLHMIEPQAEGCLIWELPDHLTDIYFIYLEGREVFK